MITGQTTQNKILGLQHPVLEVMDPKPKKIIIISDNGPHYQQYRADDYIV